MKKIFLAILMVVLLPFSISHAKEVPDHDTNYYLDELNVLSEETKEEINKQNFSDGSQIFVLTVKDLDEDPFDFSMKAFKKYQLGDKEKNNGLLIMLAETKTGKHHIQVITGYGLEEILPDGKVGRIIDEYMMPEFLKDNLDKGINQGFKAFTRIIEQMESAPETTEEEIKPVPEPIEESSEEEPVYLEETPEPIEEESVYSEETMSPTESLLLSYLLVLFVVPIGVLISMFHNEAKIKRMTYEDFLKKTRRNGDYKDRFQEVVKNKEIEVLKKDMRKATTFKDLFENEYKRRKKLVYKTEKVETLIKESKEINRVDFPAYQEVVAEKIKRINTDELKAYLLAMRIYNPIYKTLKEEYIRRKRKEISTLSLDELARRQFVMRDNFLNERDIDEIIKEEIEIKVEKMEDDELEKIARNEYLRKIVERELEKREETYRSNNSDSSWFDDFTSWGNFSGGSSSFGGGGFSGGGGSSGGGGAGRSF